MSDVTQYSEPSENGEDSEEPEEKKLEPPQGRREADQRAVARRKVSIVARCH
jgi:hypothetical protein